MIYLDNAATTFPKPESVYRAVDDCLRNYCANPGRGGHKLSLQSGRVLLEARELLAELFNADSPDNVILTHNATEALNLALKGFLKKGSHVITTSMEHNSVMRPLKVLEKLGIETTIAQCNEYGEIDIGSIEKEIKKETALIAAAHASNVVGTIIPIEDIGDLAKRYGLAFLVDASQTAGVYEIDMQKMNISMLAFAGHKSLMGPQGTGGLCIKRGLELTPLQEGGTGSKSESLYQPDIMPDRFESGTHNTPGIAGLCAGLSFIKSKGIDKIRAHEQELVKYFLDGLAEIKNVKVYGVKEASKQAPVVSINIGDTGSSEISYILDRTFDIATRSGLHCAPMAHKTLGTLEQGTVRFSFGFFNTKEQVGAALNAVENIGTLL
ncbi:MAG TPA: aminotransferase class V-fold PLP-dependent enzyme [Bacillota bacterium]|nr:aminotransferase class V-fold PLP-dependent enzyme [Clostridiaceae bacterium]HNR04464.1 aminotransferase class V-fold PLP-dependent enzyme [Bacillota bacterium]HNT03567.1 aminotransferase class V-fold PLP-dependent enzyme [Bacillota bacterium]HPA54132.1 aminotransferase class V-fold PLP-dependent enzyme [Bacillota bacterium]HPX69667.1 aminotransferase class V-fold PLP-dependent enzyme [Bacillota bacterium]